ncbi:MAG: DmsE family decaheme c-type cytochrome [Acidobacteriota bacterium]
MRRTTRWFHVVTSSLIVLTASWVLAKAQTASSTAPPQSNEYVTSATCASCHDDLAKKFASNPHNLLETRAERGWQDRSCESCHGPGEAHTNAGDGSQIVAYNGDPVRTVNQNCLKCHARSETHAGINNSLHGKNQIACTDCHKIHDAKQPVHLLATKKDQLCWTCHRETKAAFAKPFRHRLTEGAIDCIDCHQPHGGQIPRQLVLANGSDVACIKCHSDKQGPFAFEHPAMRLQGCVGCHEPHGSVNPKMLVRHQQRFLCLECHSMSSGLLGAQPPSFHDLRSARFQNCTTCHLKVHGSNVNKHLLR